MLRSSIRELLCQNNIPLSNDLMERRMFITDERNSIFLSLFIFALLLVPSVIIERDVADNCCSQGEVYQVATYINDKDYSSGVGILISSIDAENLAMKHAGGSVVENDFFDTKNNPLFRIKTVTKNAGKIYITWIDAKTGKIKFSDESWLLSNIF